METYGQRRRTKVAAGLAAIAVLAAGCGGSTKGEAEPAKESTAPSSAPSITTPAKDLVLTAAELPAGITVVPVSDAQLKEVVDQMSGAASTAKFSPAGCASATALTDATKKLDVSQVGLVTGSTDTGAVSETVASEKPDIAKLRENFAGKCNSMRADMSVQGQQVSSEITTTLRDAPKTSATDAVVLHQVNVSTTAGQNVTQRMLLGFAQVGGYSVSVTAIGMTGEPDAALFDRVFVAAVAKVAKG
ncbi:MULTISPECIES: hypothetical protein [Tsukamurella]|uniref:Sensor domain-containing protein n=1 Tax=Tsukamurella strandjordii TaxID=147577 RepID=A0AA90N8N2_9ACTN|nr:MULTISPECIES: hypothetical protein [Tsukamurella]MDP0397038.1 hypothetical protein [Tsukamurella strandjordii]GIZ96839.1 hypothetical protein TTY48_14510 [Tsukamurella sp. TY48]